MKAEEKQNSVCSGSFKVTNKYWKALICGGMKMFKNREKRNRTLKEY